MKDLVVINIIPSGIGGIQTYGKTLEKKLKGESIVVERIETYKVDKTSNLVSEVSKKIVRFFANCIRLSKLVKKYKEEGKRLVIHAHVGKGISFWENAAYGLWGKVLKVPFIFHIHSSLLHIEFKKSNGIIKGIMRYILFKTSKIIALSEYWKKQLLQIDGLHSEKVIVIYNFINVERFDRYSKLECRKVLGLPPDKKIVFGIGRLVERKGYQYLVDAVLHIIKERQDILFFIGGRGPMEGYLKKRIQELGLREYINFVGFVQNEMLPLWLNASDIFVMPSTRETFPIVMLEALAIGVPFVGSKVGAVPEVIFSERFGLLVEPANPRDLAEKILMALEKDWNREKIRAYAERFTWDNIARKVIDIYHNA